MRLQTGTLGGLPLRLMVMQGALERMRGLLGRTLGDGEGLLLRPCNMVHTIGMRYPIDVVFLSRAGLVVGLRPRLASRRVAACLRAHAVIELPAGDGERRRLHVGLQLPSGEVPA